MIKNILLITTIIESPWSRVVPEKVIVPHLAKKNLKYFTEPVGSLPVHQVTPLLSVSASQTQYSLPPLLL
jgi:hypothetical protein